MSLSLRQIENKVVNAKSGVRKWIKNQKVRKIRRTPVSETVNIKYKGWEA